MARALSLLLAVAVSVGLMLLPAMRGGELTQAGHGLLLPLVIAVCALFVHGLGYRPRRRMLQRLLSPWLLWPLTLACAAFWWQLAQADRAPIGQSEGIDALQFERCSLEDLSVPGLGYPVYQAPSVPGAIIPK